jgi:tetratricopeptide (TPR) repeat protein
MAKPRWNHTVESPQINSVSHRYRGENAFNLTSEPSNMKHLSPKFRFSCALSFLAIALCGMPLQAQQNITGLPLVSQKQVLIQTIGMTKITLEYHRPLVKERKLWGGLVPYSQVWRAGANDNTTISFEHPVKIEGKELAAGTYGLHMIPGESSWQVIFSKNYTSWGSFSYDEEEDALRVEVKPAEAPFQEILRYDFDNLELDGGTIAVHWGDLKVPFQVEVDTQAQVLAKLRNDLRSLPGFSWIGLNSAAAYCLQNKINQVEALEWADRALAQQENFNTLQTKAGLLEQTGKAEEAVALLDKAMGLATEGQVNALGYQFLQRGLAEKAMEAFTKNVQDHPDSWNTYDSLGEAQAGQGMKKEAIANYEKAFEMAPEAQKARISSALEALVGD